jgi:hypothetical protein
MDLATPALLPPPRRTSYSSRRFGRRLTLKKYGCSPKKAFGWSIICWTVALHGHGLALVAVPVHQKLERAEPRTLLQQQREVASRGFPHQRLADVLVVGLEMHVRPYAVIQEHAAAPVHPSGDPISERLRQRLLDLTGVEQGNRPLEAAFRPPRRWSCAAFSSSTGAGRRGGPDHDLGSGRGDRQGRSPGSSPRAWRSR